ncbi:MAG: PilT/PilU family type 4a pilus ATPase [Desulfobacterales bacterium]|nr:PilT/PilU family type 4a pilus ATPase [Desulfobacterales bacterium]
MENESVKEKPVRPKKQRIGESLIDFDLITEEQLHQALQRQSQVGGHLGSILIEMGFITIDSLLKYLSKTFGVPGVNLFKRQISPDVIRLIPSRKIDALNILPVAVDANTLTLAMVNPQDFMTISEIGFTLGKKVNPVVVPFFMMEAAKKCLFSSDDGSLDGKRVEKLSLDVATGKKSAPKLITLLKHLVKSGASDMFLCAGVPPTLGTAAGLERLQMQVLSSIDCERYAKELMSEKDWNAFILANDHDTAATYPEIGRFRINVYRQLANVSIAIRPIAEKLPSLPHLNLPDWLTSYALKQQGLILISGSVGHGKSTTLSTIVDIINEQRRCNIITLEDPVEYVHRHKQSNINQREIGRDTESFSAGLNHIFRQAPDVIVIGELRDQESVEIALRAAETGLLVLATVQASTTTSAIERIIHMFPAKDQYRYREMVLENLLLCLAQRLIPLKNGTGRRLALEKLENSQSVKNFIKEEKTAHIRTQMQVGSDHFSPIEVGIAALYNQGLITFEAGAVHADNPQFYRGLTEKDVI